MITAFFCSLFLGASLASANERVQFTRETIFSGVCDASAGAALNDDLFAAADDETNRIRVYSLSQGGAPLFELRLDSFLRTEFREPEADIEGAARVGDTIYWLTSHARNQKGKLRGSRQRFFATRIVSFQPPKLEPVGRAYAGLLADLENAGQLDKFKLDDAAELAPKEKHALNIEGLCAGPNGSLLIGFRNPVPKKKALLVPLLNPDELVANRNAHAVLGHPIRLDLDGRGIRDIVQKDGKYYIIAGAFNSADKFELYEWDGHEETTLLHRWEKDTVNPEAILGLPKPSQLLVLTDEGSKNRPCKELPPPNRRFRGFQVELKAPESAKAP